MVTSGRNSTCIRSNEFSLLQLENESKTSKSTNTHTYNKKKSDINRIKSSRLSWTTSLSTLVKAIFYVSRSVLISTRTWKLVTKYWDKIVTLSSPIIITFGVRALPLWANSLTFSHILTIFPYDIQTKLFSPISKTNTDSEWSWVSLSSSLPISVLALNSIFITSIYFYHFYHYILIDYITKMKKEKLDRNHTSKEVEKFKQKYVHFAFVKQCSHDEKEYYCASPYSSFGGLRSFLFDDSYYYPWTDDNEIGNSGCQYVNKHNNNNTCCTHNTNIKHLSSPSLLQTIIEERKSNHHKHPPNHNNNKPSSSTLRSSSLHSKIYDKIYYQLHHRHDQEDQELGNSDCFYQHTSNTLSTRSRHNSKNNYYQNRPPLIPILCCRPDIHDIDATANIKMVTQKAAELSSSASVSSKDCESLISFLAFEGVLGGSKNAPHEQGSNITKTTVNTGGSSIEASTKKPDVTTQSVLEPATLIYHESARSIVFRDHIRRVATKQSNSALTSASLTPANSDGGGSVGSNSSTTEMTSSIKAKQKSSIPIPTKISNNSKKNLLNKTSYKSKVSSLTTYDDDSIQSYDSKNSKKSKNSLRSRLSKRSNKKRDSISLAESHHSVSSFDIDASIHNDDKMACDIGDDTGESADRPQVIIANFTPTIEPLPSLELGPHNEFSELLLSKPFVWKENEGPEEAVINDDVWKSMTNAEKEVATMMLHQKCLVKTIKKADWTGFLQKFVLADDGKSRHFLHPTEYQTCTKEEKYKKYSEKNHHLPFNSFMTSTSLLPNAGMKMRCYGSNKEYVSGVIFALPTDFPLDGGNEDAAAERTHTWSWPSGYAAKTEFNITPYGELINGRKEALVSISELRAMNHTYLYETDYEMLGRMVKGGLKTLPYNEIFCRVGGEGSFLESKNGSSSRSLENGIGLPIGIFVRSASYGDLIGMLRIRARMSSLLGKDEISGIPLFYITPEEGIHVITEAMQAKLLHTMTNTLNPFQNPSLKHKTTIDNTSEKHLDQKLQELFDLDDDNIRGILTPEECARLAGGFGATDDSLTRLLMDAMLEDFDDQNEPNSSTKQKRLQSLVNEGLSSAVRSGDFNTSRQLLILYSLVAARGQQEKERDRVPDQRRSLSRGFSKQLSSSSVMSEMTKSKSDELIKSSSHHHDLSTHLHPPPPPPLDTDRLRSATNSDGLLAVLGAAEVLKSMQNEAAKTRTLEAIKEIEEWIGKSEHSVAYRLAHWRDLTAAQGDLKIATEESSHFMAFVSNKAIHNRKRFAQQLRDSVSKTNFESIQFLKSIHDLVSTMHAPCLRLELLQFILGLDNRYSVAHVARSVELAATCLNMSAYETIFSHEEEADEDNVTDHD